MKKSVIALSTVALLVSGGVLANTKAGDLQGGLEFDSKFSMNNPKHAEGSEPGLKKTDFGAKLYMSYQGVGLSFKAKNDDSVESNLNYTYGWEHVFVKGEAELVTKRYGNDQRKLGLTVGSHVNGLFDTSVRYREDRDTESYNGAKKSNVNRIDLFVGKQLTDNLYLGAKAINFDQQNSAINAEAGNKKNWNNFEVKATFTGFDNMKPFVEYENAYIQKANRRDDNLKVGVAFPF